MTDKRESIILSEAQEKEVQEGRFDWEALVAARRTDPRMTTSANIRGNNITAIDPAYQQAQAERVWGLYGTSWGLFSFDITEEDVVGNKNRYAILRGTFQYPGGAFPVVNGILTGSYAQGKFDPEWPKKLVTNTISKALSMVGFNRDVFMGKFDDDRYVKQLADEYAADEAPRLSDEQLAKLRSLLDHAGMTEQDLCDVMKVAELALIPEARLPAIEKRLVDKANAKEKK